jgi:hypothetical protein
MANIGPAAAMGAVVFDFVLAKVNAVLAENNIDPADLEQPPAAVDGNDNHHNAGSGGNASGDVGGNISVGSKNASGIVTLSSNGNASASSSSGIANGGNNNSGNEIIMSTRSPMPMQLLFPNAVHSSRFWIGAKEALRFTPGNIYPPSTMRRKLLDKDPGRNPAAAAIIPPPRIPLPLLLLVVLRISLLITLRMLMQASELQIPMSVAISSRICDRRADPEAGIGREINLKWVGMVTIRVGVVIIAMSMR